MKRIDLTQPAKQAATLLIYGPPGSGKSTICAQLARSAEEAGKPATLLDAERGLLPAALAAGLRNAELLDASGDGCTAEVLQALQAMVSRPVGLVALDTITEVSEAILRELSAATGSPQLQHYGEQKHRLARIVRALRDAAGGGTCAVATAQQDAAEVEGLPGHWHPAVRKALVTDLVSQFDAVARVRQVADHEAEALNLDPGTRYLDFRPNPQQVAKCRIAGELFAGREPRWHLWPLRNQSDTTRLFAALTRQSAQKEEASHG